MNQFSHLSHTNLLDMLARHTAEYTQMLADNNKSDDFYKCSRIVEKLTEELEARMREAPHDTERPPAGDTSPGDPVKTVPGM